MRAKGFTLIEVTVAIGLSAAILLIAGAFAGRLTQEAQKPLDQALAATIAMAIAQYRTEDMIEKSTLTKAAGLTIDSTNFKQRLGCFDSSVSSSTAYVAGTCTWQAWMNNCPLFSKFYDGASTPVQYRYAVAANSNVRFIGGIPAELPPFTVTSAGWDVPNRIYLIDSATLSMMDIPGDSVVGQSVSRAGTDALDSKLNEYNTLESYSHLYITFSQPSNDTIYQGPMKARFLIMSIWSSSREIAASINGRTPFRMPQPASMTFLGRYPILDSCVP